MLGELLDGRRVGGSYWFGVGIGIVWWRPWLEVWGGGGEWNSGCGWQLCLEGLGGAEMSPLGVV